MFALFVMFGLQVRCYSAEFPKDTEHSPHVVVPFIFVYFLDVIDCRSVQAGVFTLHIMPRGVSSTLDYAHVASVAFSEYMNFKLASYGVHILDSKSSVS